MMGNELMLFQMSDSNFPIGTFSHSFGFETYMLNQQINNDKDFSIWLKHYMKTQIVNTDGFAIRRVYEALLGDNWQRVIDINNELNAFLTPKEIRDGNKRMGKQFMKLARLLIGNDKLDQFEKMLKEQEVTPHQVVIFTITAYFMEVDVEQTINVYLMNMVITITQNAVRGIPIGQKAGQSIIFGYQEKIKEWTDYLLTNEDVPYGAVAPGIEIAQMEHEFLRARNFMS